MKKGQLNSNYSFLTMAKCTSCGKEYDASDLLTICSCGKVLFAHYDLEKAKESVTHDMKARRYDIWRMFEIMPVLHEKYRYTLGEGWTPVIKLQQVAKHFSLDNLFLKDEGQNPTGTFKSRGLCAAVSKAVELGAKEFVIPSAGNAGAALSAYSTRAGSKSNVYMPNDAPKLIQQEVIALGGQLKLVDGLISDAGREAKEIGERNGWFNISTLKEPYRVEGKKTMGLELAEQFNWELPDTIIYPTGGGTGIVGMWKAFDELEKIGLIDNKRPKMISVQAANCAPIVKAFNEGKNYAETWDNAQTFAAGLRVPAAIGDYLILEAIKESSGTAIAVTDKEIRQSMLFLAKTEGIMLAPEAAATIAATEKLAEKGFLNYDEEIVLFGTGSGLTTPEEW
ncbi:MAG: threonine synthase [Candidatus Kariarchaeaceae archaeon]